MEDLDTPFIGAFLGHLEKERGNSARTRNVRLAAIHSFFRYVALHEPRHGALAQRVLAMPSKRYTKRPVEFLTRAELEALLAAPHPSTWAGRRDRTLLLRAAQSGLRASELIGLRCQDIAFGAGAHVRCHGKGRKERCTPLRKDTASVLRSWLQERQGQPTDPLFPNARGGPLSHDGLEHLLAKHASSAQLRHTAAMALLQHGIDRAVIALWLGHESVETTYIYLHADLALKEQALAKTAPSNVRPSRYRPDDHVLAFLRSL